jgi:hypothetical protein
VLENKLKLINRYLERCSKHELPEFSISFSDKTSVGVWVRPGIVTILPFFKKFLRNLYKERYGYEVSKHTVFLPTRQALKRTLIKAYDIFNKVANDTSLTGSKKVYRQITIMTDLFKNYELHTCFTHGHELGHMALYFFHNKLPSYFSESVHEGLAYAYGFRLILESAKGRMFSVREVKRYIGSWIEWFKTLPRKDVYRIGWEFVLKDFSLSKSDVNSAIKWIDERIDRVLGEWNDIVMKSFSERIRRILKDQ